MSGPNPGPPPPQQNSSPGPLPGDGGNQGPGALGALFDGQLLSTLIRLAETMRREMAAPDDRVRLMQALSPFLSENRRRRAEEAVGMLRFLKVIEGWEAGRIGTDRGR
ncbi:MAG: hypothetical protein IJK02_09050 [Clostridia bacterium]|nr:hypothetical protein [Clostridia bacterium]